MGDHLRRCSGCGSGRNGGSGVAVAFVVAAGSGGRGAAAAAAAATCGGGGGRTAATAAAGAGAAGGGGGGDAVGGGQLVEGVGTWHRYCDLEERETHKATTCHASQIRTTAVWPLIPMPSTLYGRCWEDAMTDTDKRSH